MKPLFGLPEKVEFCSRCVISNQRPRSTVEFKNSKDEIKQTIEFQNGVCEACLFNDEKENQINWEKREEELFKLCDKYRKKNGYDVIIPGSGGKDSAFTSHILKNKYGMNPLTVTWAPHMYTEIGWQNFTNWSHVGGLDNILMTPNGDLHRYLTREAFLNLLHPFQPFIVGQRIIGPMIAGKFDVQLVMYGENQAEYGNKRKENYTPLMEQKFFNTDSINDLRLAGKQLSQLLTESKFGYREFEPYFPLRETSKIQPEVHYLGYYLRWDPQECFYYAVENTGFKPNTERTEGTYSKYSSIDDKIDPFHYYTSLIKFGLGRASYDAAQEIRNKKITRDEGINLVQLFDNEFPKKYFSEFLEYISLTEGQFFEVVDKNRSPHLWERNSKNEWQLKYAVWQ
jgi:N-acetyl sugar amidotransferase